MLWGEGPAAVFAIPALDSLGPDPLKRNLLEHQDTMSFGVGPLGGIIKRCVKVGLGGGILMRDNLKRRKSHHGRDGEVLV
jgi:hypothetical protein